MSGLQQAFTTWAYEQTAKVGLNPSEVILDDGRILFVFDRLQDASKMQELKQACIDSDFIHEPFVLNTVEDTSTQDAENQGEIVWSLGIHNKELDVS